MYNIVLRIVRVNRSQGSCQKSALLIPFYCPFSGLAFPAPLCMHHALRGGP